MTAEIGPLLRRARLARSMSLRGLAGEIGVSPSLLSQVETGKTQPSVSTLYALSSYLGISMDELLSSDPDVVPRISLTNAAVGSHPDSPVQRAHQNPHLDMDNGVRWERLAVGQGGPVEPLLVTYAPGASSSIEGKMMRHGGFEYAYLLEGHLTLKLDFEVYELGPGDSLQFDSVRPHMYFNYSDVVARGIWLVVGRYQSSPALKSTAPEPLSAGRLNVEVVTAVEAMNALSNRG